MQARSSRCSPGITLWVLKKGPAWPPLAMRSQPHFLSFKIGVNALQLFKNSSSFCKTQLLRNKKKQKHPHQYPHDPGPSAFSHSKSFNCKAFSTNNPNRQRSWSTGTDPNPKPSTRQPSQSSAINDATHKWAIAWPRIFWGNKHQ